MKTTNISALKINKLTRKQYAEAVLAGIIKEDEQVYLVKPDDGKFAGGVSTSKYEGEGDAINTTPQFRNTIIVSSDEEAEAALSTLAIGDMVFVKEV